LGASSSVSGYLVEIAGNVWEAGWNRSSRPMQSIGKTPVQLGKQLCLSEMKHGVPALWMHFCCVGQAGGHLVAGVAIPSGCQGSRRANPWPPVPGVATGQCSLASASAEPGVDLEGGYWI